MQCHALPTRDWQHDGVSGANGLAPGAASAVIPDQLTLEAPPTNLEPNFNTCPTQIIGTIVTQDGKRGYVPMRWGLVPSW
jgi:putative SOS response-associated peptidase YedK